MPASSHASTCELISAAMNFCKLRRSSSCSGVNIMKAFSQLAESADEPRSTYPSHGEAKSVRGRDSCIAHALDIVDTSHPSHPERARLERADFSLAADRQ